MSRSRAQSDQVRSQILADAAEAFAEAGYGEASLRDIGQRVGLTAAALYNYFDSKQDLLRAIIVDATTALAATLMAEASRGDDPADRLARVVRAHMSFTLDNKAQTTVILEQAHLLNDMSFAIVREKQMGILNLYRACIRELLLRRGKAHVDATVCAFNVLATINGLPRWFREGRRLSRDELLDQSVAFVFRGLFGEPTA